MLKEGKEGEKVGRKDLLKRGKNLEEEIHFIKKRKKKKK
jgi:hypothetical protein